jgi:hypothetical protein
VAVDLKVAVILDIFVALAKDNTTVPVNTEEDVSVGGPRRINGLIGSNDNRSCVSNPKCISLMLIAAMHKTRN